MRTFNFAAGPATLPTEVLEEAQRELLDYRGTGMSIMEMSHRGKEYGEIHEETLANLRSLLGISDDYAVLLLQGGATGQFAMVPLNLLSDGQTADYTHSGSWGGKAIKEAKLQGSVHVAANSSKESPARMPMPDELSLSPQPAYLHITSNETISGIQWHDFPVTSTPLVADMSSDILCRPLDVSRFGLIYAGAQKNLGPAGVTIVIIRKDLAERAGDQVPMIWKYQTHIEANSLYHTPPTFTVYLVCLVTRWVIRRGGLSALQEMNEAKAAKLYAAVDATGFYRGTAHPDHRSIMNVTFRLPTEELEKKFLAEATARRLSGLKGHRSVGGIRASIYNAFPPEGVDALIEFMQAFERANG